MKLTPNNSGIKPFESKDDVREQVAYEDFTRSNRAIAVSKRVDSQCGGPASLIPTMWRLDVLSDPSLLKVAVSEALAEDFIVVANGQLAQLNQALHERSRDLIASNGQLQQEIFERKSVEESLRKSEQHYCQLLEQSRRMQEQLRLLSRQLLSAQEQERKKISCELHDEIAQTLTGINVQLETLKVEARVSVKGFQKKITHTQQMVQRSMDTLHRFARELRPAALDDLGLIPALHAFMKEFTKRTGVHIRFTTFTSSKIEQLNDATRTVFYRVAQEALTNVARHAQASLVEVKIEKLPNAICLTIKDNGKSFQAQSVMCSKQNTRLGLLGMRERLEMVGGSFSIESAPGKGTTVRAQIPLDNYARGSGLLMESVRGRL